VAAAEKLTGCGGWDGSAVDTVPLDLAPDRWFFSHGNCAHFVAGRAALVGIWTRVAIISRYC